MNRPLPKSTLPQEGELYGKYELVKKIATGGMAEVFKAMSTSIGGFRKLVALKRILPHLSTDAEFVSLFIDEAKLTVTLGHSNIVQVLDFGRIENNYYIAMEFVDGRDMTQVLIKQSQKKATVPIEIACYIIAQTLRGLEYAHTSRGRDEAPLGIVHRDVSPKNIRITPDGSVKIIDFGIARAQNRATETAAGTIKGTLGYMSPEQILGDEIDHRSDIFAYGIVLFQMLTCRNPFDGPTLKERVRRLTSEPIPSIRNYNPALDSEIEGIVARCLDRDIDLRYQDLAEVQNELDAYLARLQVVSPKRRLISFLEEIFPSLNDDDDQLKNVLTQVSTFLS